MQSRTLWLWLLLGVWALCMVMGFLWFAFLPATDFGLTRGLNRVMALWGWQMAALLLTFPIWILRRGAASRALRRVAMLPLAWAALLSVAAVVVVFWAMWHETSGVAETPPPREVTTPPVPN